MTLVLAVATAVSAQTRSAPPGTFVELDDDVVADALILRGKQLFVDDFLIEHMHGLVKQLHQPTKSDKNPLLVRDKPWEPAGPGYGTVFYDPELQLFRMWYEVYGHGQPTDTSTLLYATSRDGIAWDKPLVDQEGGTNRVQQPGEYGFVGSGIFRDPHERDPARRYKMLYSCKPDKMSRSLMTSAAYSADGIHWTSYPELPLIPFSDTQNCPYWDEQRGRYVAHLRFGPPNTRIISRTESEDFVHWSPKLTVLRQTKMDGPLSTQFYQMAPFAYGDVYFGFIAAYHKESLGPVTEEEPWTDRKNLQLAFSRNGITWSRVGLRGAIRPRELDEERDWKSFALDAVFLPYGERDKDWDWGTVSPLYSPEPIIVGDSLWFYYTGINAKNWWTWSGDPPMLDPAPKEPQKGIGLATLRLDGFVSVNAGADEGVLTTKPLVFLGDTLVVNANADGGRLQVEAIDGAGNPVPGFGRADCVAVTTDDVRHVIRWNGQPDCHLLQGRPVRLRFYLQNAELYAFEARTQHNHYLQSYD